MNLRRVKVAGLYYHCRRCEAVMYVASQAELAARSRISDIVYADHDGPPFEAFYCDGCTGALIENPGLAAATED